MTKSALKLASVGALALAFAGQAMAEIKLNDTFSVSGYVAGSYQYSKTSSVIATDRLDVDSSQLLFKYNSAPVTGVASVYYVPNQAPDEATLLDAYATYDAGNGVTVTGGKWTTYRGMAQRATDHAETIGRLPRRPARPCGLERLFQIGHA